MKCTVESLLHAHKTFKDNPDTHYRIANTFPEEVWTWKEYHDWFMRCLHNKINVMGKIVQSGKCYTYEYEIGMMRDKQNIQDYFQKRIRHSGCHGLLSTKECKQRYPYIDCQPYE